MTLKRKCSAFAPAVLGSLLLASQAWAGMMAYPSADKASFVIDMPDDWKMTPGEKVGDYVDVEGPTGVVLSFRTIPGSEAQMKQAVQESIAFIDENYKDVKMNDPSTVSQHGLDGFVAGGNGKDKEDSSDVTFVMAWFALKDGTIGELWAVAKVNDKKGIDQAKAVLNSFRAP